MAAQSLGAASSIKDIKFNYNLIRKFINECNANKKSENKWLIKNEYTNSYGWCWTRFEKAGYAFPKPIIEIENKPDSAGLLKV